MDDFSLDDILQGGTDATTGQELLRSIESYDEAMRDLYRPLTNEEKVKIKAIVNEMETCLPNPEDAFIIHKLIDAFHLLTGMGSDLPSSLNVDDDEDEGGPSGMPLEENSGLKELYFRLGMAYERLRSSGLF